MAKDKKIGEVKIYGDIYSFGYNSAASFIERFEDARKGMDEMRVHLHTDGGDVMEGTLIYNHIKSCDIPVDVYVDGVCCSMGTVVMMAARRVYMCENSYLMVHAPQGSCYGTASDIEKVAKGLRGMEKNFKKIYAAKTGRNEKEVEELLDGDNWFTAQEAMDAKLIDGIVKPIATGVTPVTAEELKTQTPTALYKRFSACLKEEAQEDKTFSNNHKKQSEMDKDGLIKKFGLTGVTAESSDQEIEDAIQAKLDAEKQRADNAEKREKEAEEKRITDAVEAAFNGSKITAEEKAVYVAIGKKNGFEALNTVLKGVRPAPSLVSVTRGGNAGGSAMASRETWTWEQWQKEDPRGLEKMSKEEPEKFNAIYEGAFK